MSTGLDPVTRRRISEEMQALNDAMDSFAANPSPETREQLRKACDELMRAAGRMLLDLS
jgi:hypothetical protein